MKNPSDPIRNRNGDLPACSAAPPPNAPSNILSDKILYFVDRACRYKFLPITNLTHFFMYLFISSLYMFRASQRPSSGDRIVLIHHLLRLVCVSAWYAGQEGTVVYLFISSLYMFRASQCLSSGDRID